MSKTRGDGKGSPRKKQKRGYDLWGEWGHPRMAPATKYWRNQCHRLERRKGKRACAETG